MKGQLLGLRPEGLVDHREVWDLRQIRDEVGIGLDREDLPLVLRVEPGLLKGDVALPEVGAAVDEDAPGALTQLIGRRATATSALPSSRLIS